MITAPLTARELAAARAKHQLVAARLGNRQPFGRSELCDALIDHWLAVQAEIQRQEARR